MSVGRAGGQPGNPIPGLTLERVDDDKATYEPLARDWTMSADDYHQIRRHLMVLLTEDARLPDGR